MGNKKLASEYIIQDNTERRLIKCFSHLLHVCHVLYAGNTGSNRYYLSLVLNRRKSTDQN